MPMIEKHDDDIYNKEIVDSVVNSISEEIMVDNIINQITSSLNEKTLETKTDLFNYFEQRYRYLISTYSYDMEIIRKVIDSFNEVLEKIKTALEDTFRFKITFDQGIDFDTKITLVKSLYEFFILYIRDNTISLIYNTITKNIETLKKICQIRNKKDLSYVNLKKIINNDYTPVIFCLETIIKDIELDCNDDVINYMILDDPDLCCNFYVNKIFTDCFFSDIIFEGNLYNLIKDKIINDYGMQLFIKNRLIKRYS